MRLIPAAALLSAWMLAPACCLAQTTPPPRATPADPGPATITARSTLVVVPALVRDKSGEPIFTLKAEDFTLNDDGVPQKLRLEEDTGGEPLALVVLIEAGGDGVRELSKYAALPAMLESVVGGVPHMVAVVAFDSTPELEQALRAVSDPNTSIYSIAFSSAKSDVAHEASKFSSNEPGPAHGCFARNHKDDPETSDNPLIQTWDCLSLLAPPLRLIKMAALATEGLRTNVPETVARLTGGEYFKLGNQKNLERTLQTLSNHLPNRYVLSFQPQSPHPGLHVINLELKEYPQLKVTARTSYWVEGAPPPPSPKP